VKPYPSRLASGTRLTATTILHLSITDQIEAVILADPTCSRASSQHVDRLLVCSEAFGGQW
jgi:hypothetical protein